MKQKLRQFVLGRREILKKQNLFKLIFPLVGLLSLIWFLVRVIPKPSRATYPCMRAAFPFASAFIAWLISLSGSILLIRKARALFRITRNLQGALIVILAVVVHYLAIAVFPGFSSMASDFRSRAVLNSTSSYIFPDPESNISTPRSTVAIVQSEIPEASQINAAEIESMVREAITLAGGLGDIISNGDTVILKPNLVSPHIQTGTYETLTPGSNGVDTDYRVIQAAVNIVRELNPDGTIILMEGSAMGSTSNAFSILGWDMITGLDEVVFLEDICAWQEKDSPALVRLSLPEDKFLYTAHSNTYYMSRLYYEADVLISIPCLKNHLSAGITGGVKNVGIGATPSRIYGMGPSDSSNPFGRWSTENGIDHGWEPLNNWIHDFYMLRPVDFVIMDGLQGIQFGPGPHRGDDLQSNQKNMRLILAGKDAVAVDAIEALVMSHDPEKVLHLTSLHEDGVGCADPRYIKVAGMKVDEVEKAFGNAENGNLVKHYDILPPEPRVNDIRVEADRLQFSLLGDETVSRVDVMINDQLLEESIVGGFDNVTIGLPEVPAGEDRIRIIVYDKYLNHKTIELAWQPTSVERVEWNAIDIYPNPASGRFNIRISAEAEGTIRVTMLGMNGAVQKSFEWTKGTRDFTGEVTVDDLPEGTYILTLEFNHFRSVRKIIVKR
jgi:uncharacterized protein (DUF362 family)